MNNPRIIQHIEQATTKRVAFLDNEDKDMSFETKPPLEQKPGTYSPDVTALQVLQQRAQAGDSDAQVTFRVLCSAMGYEVITPETVEV